MLTLVVKGTFLLTPDQKVASAPAGDQLPLSGDVDGVSKAEGLYVYESDFAPFKPRTDLLLHGKCHTPGGQPMKGCPVTFAVGDRTKTLWIFGNRSWKRSVTGLWRSTAPEPFSSMPLGYENSFGGNGYDRNPIGKGFMSRIRSNGSSVRELPNIEDSEELVTSPYSKIEPPGFGPLDRMWPQRLRLAGTLNKKWIETRWPQMPSDLDWGYFNAAPSDMQVEGYLRGDETMLFENMHPSHPVLRSHLPGIRMRCFVREQAKDPEGFKETAMRLDTLWADPENERVVLVWRGVAAVRTADTRKIDTLMVAAEEIGSPRVDPDEYWARHQAIVASSEDVAGGSDTSGRYPDTAQSETQSSALSDPSGDPTEQMVAAEVDKALQQAYDIMKQSGVDPGPMPNLQSEGDVEAFFARLYPDYRPGEMVNSRQMDAIREPARQAMRQALIDQGEDASVLDELFSTDDGPGSEDKWSRGKRIRLAVEEEKAGARSFRGQDLSGVDFSGLDLGGADFKEAVLDDAKFIGADLQEADFSNAGLERADFSQAKLGGVSFVSADLSEAGFKRADLAGADLSQAILSGSDLTLADLTNAVLEHATFEGACLDKAILRSAKARQSDFSEARLSHADLSEADIRGALFAAAQMQQADLRCCIGEKAMFTGADMSEAHLDGGKLAGANFSDATVRRTHFHGADLSQATFERATGKAVDMSEADLTGLRAGEGVHFPGGIFVQTTSPRSIWTDAHLDGADFSYARLGHADFSRARLEKASFKYSQCRYANFDAADLNGADFHEADLFLSNLARSDLSGSNLSKGNFYGAEFIDAVFSKINIQGANLKMSKLAGR